MDAFSAQNAPFGQGGVKFVTTVEYVSILNDLIAGVANHFQRNAALMETRRVFASPVVLGAATVAGGLNNAYRFTDSRVRYTPRLINLRFTGGDLGGVITNPQIAYQAQGGRKGSIRIRSG